MALALSASPVHQEPQPGKQLRNQLAAVVRSINWSYAFFWSISSTHPGVLTWKDGFYNGEIKTRKIANSAELTADQLVMQRSKQLRELYESLLSGECNHRAARPIASLSPEDLADTEWLPGRSFASNEHVWLCNAHLADSKAFPRALLAKSASIQTIVCVPLMSGVLELGTTDSVMEDPDVVTRATTSLWELQFPVCTEEPSSSPSADEIGEVPDIILFEDLDHNAMETMIHGAQELGEVERLSNTSLEHITMEIDEFYNLCEELVVQPLEGDWIMDRSLEVPSSAQPSPWATTSSSTPIDGSHVTNFTAWMRSSDYDEMMVPAIREPQKLLKKVVTGGSWINSGGGGSTARTQESGIKNHVVTERRRREKLNEMFLILKSLVPSIHKVDKASVLAETIAYLKELERRVQELESREDLISHPVETRGQKRHDKEIIEKRACGAKRKKDTELRADMEGEHNWVLSKDGTSNITVTVTEKDVLLEVQCRWEELMVTRVFDAIKSLHLDVLSVQASTTDGFMGLKIRAQFTSSAAVVPRMINEAIRKAIYK
ncbi:anthocyanin regulatory R-S protein-like isoform X4 [Phragmites australis]|uniref:anthocyanin regulatory R-S protein-like isoform X4 n=1 Tax=Phragmites australis TaxID=29695 RepID=UPI002D77187A|nr:anthocyanin regulatory R-S protein-like isoform X4 [Phragmites australis]